MAACEDMKKARQPCELIPARRREEGFRASQRRANICPDRDSEGADGDSTARQGDQG
jgi:hypothetical protein